MVVNIIKVILGIKSIFIWIKYKLLYGNRIVFSFINSIRGKLSISIEKKSKIRIGKHIRMEGPLYLKAINSGEIDIGDNCYFNHNCSVTSLGKIKIGNKCLFANNVVVVDHDHSFDEAGISSDFTIDSVTIGNRVWIGSNSVILKGVTIGDNAIIAAGAVVTHSIPPFEIWGGVPARKLRSLSSRTQLEKNPRD